MLNLRYIKINMQIFIDILLLKIGGISFLIIIYYIIIRQV